MKNLWLSYAWLDNDSGDVFFAAQQLQKSGVQIRLDRWDLSAGRRLWDQIANLISSPLETDGWAIYGTQNSLSSEPCREELAYALDRALSIRGNEYPIIGIFPGHLSGELVPPALKTRLYVSMTDPLWAERVVAAVNRQPLQKNIPAVEPFEIREPQGQTLSCWKFDQEVESGGRLSLQFPLSSVTV